MRTAPDGDSVRYALRGRWRAHRRANPHARRACPPGGTRDPAARGTAADAPPAALARPAPPRCPLAPLLASGLVL